MDTFYSPDQVAEKLPQVTKGQLAQWRFNGTGPRYRKVGKKILYAESDLIAFLDGAVRTGTAVGAVRTGTAVGAV
jgi:hypothetical protein